jgi:hypothetical protein
MTMTGATKPMIIRAGDTSLTRPLAPRHLLRLSQSLRIWEEQEIRRRSYPRVTLEHSRYISRMTTISALRIVLALLLLLSILPAAEAQTACTNCYNAFACGPQYKKCTDSCKVYRFGDNQRIACNKSCQPMLTQCMTAAQNRKIVAVSGVHLEFRCILSGRGSAPRRIGAFRQHRGCFRGPWHGSSAV